jgi:hypothetical protein
VTYIVPVLPTRAYGVTRTTERGKGIEDSRISHGTSDLRLARPQLVLHDCAEPRGRLMRLHGGASAPGDWAEIDIGLPDRMMTTWGADERDIGGVCFCLPSPIRSLPGVGFGKVKLYRA